MGDGTEQELSANDDRISQETHDGSDDLSHIVLERARRCVDRVVKKEGDPNVHIARLLRDVILELDAMRQRGKEEP